MPLGPASKEISPFGPSILGCLTDCAAGREVDFRLIGVDFGRDGFEALGPAQPCLPHIVGQAIRFPSQLGGGFEIALGRHQPSARARARGNGRSSTPALVPAALRSRLPEQNSLLTAAALGERLPVRSA